MEIIIVLLLIILNGIFAMAEIAIISSRKSKLQQQAHDGDSNAITALELSENPNRFLSTVQIGITLVGIFAGAFGGATIAESLSDQLRSIPAIGPYSDIVALTLVVVVITYLTLIIGELVPKRLGMSNPEKIAGFVAKPMNTLSLISGPIVALLSFSTDWMLKLLRVPQYDAPTVSQEEVRMLIHEGARVGVFDIAEKDIVERTLRLGDKKVNTIMTPRSEIVWLDIDSSFKSLRSKVIKHQHSHFPVCRDNLDRIFGVVRTEDLLINFLKDEKIDIKKTIHKPIFIPENTEVLKVLELFKKTGVHMVLIVDEYGSILGILSLTDILEEIVGDIPHANDFEEEEIMKRSDGSYLIDGLVSIDEFKEHFHIKKLPGERSGAFLTVGGFVMNRLERVPVTGDNFELDNMHFEVVDMDGNRVDKIIFKKLQS